MLTVTASYNSITRKNIFLFDYSLKREALWITCPSPGPVNSLVAPKTVKINGAGNEDWLSQIIDTGTIFDDLEI